MGAALEAMLDQRRAWKGGGPYVPLPPGVVRGVTAPNTSGTTAPTMFELRLSPDAEVLAGASPVSATSLAISIEDLEDLGALGGSCASRQVRHRPTGSRWAIKRRPNNEQCTNEEAVNRIYAALGASMPDTFIVADGNVAYLVQRMHDGQTWQAMKQDPASQSRYAAVRQTMGQHFILDCLFANWDVIGARGGDNILIDAAGSAFRIDNAGVCNIRAQGEPKHASGWGKAVTELFLMRDPTPGGNETAGDMFKDVSDEAVVEQVRAILQEGDALFSHLAPHDRSVLALRVQWLKEWMESRVGNVVSDEVGIAQLVSMGFDRDAAAAALTVCNNDIEQALLQMTMGSPVPASPGAETAVDPDAVEQIVNMGFDRDSAESALAACQGDLAAAVGILTS